MPFQLSLHGELIDEDEKFHGFPTLANEYVHPGPLVALYRAYNASYSTIDKSLEQVIASTALKGEKSSYESNINKARIPRTIEHVQ